MPVPEILTSEARGLYGMIGGLLTRGVGADSIYHYLQTTQMPLPRATVRQVAGEIRATLGFSQSLARLDPASLIPGRLAPVNSSLRMSGYLTTATAMMTDTVTGFQWQQYFSYVSDTLPAPQDVFGAFQDSVDAGGVYESQAVVLMSLVKVQRGAQ